MRYAEDEDFLEECYLAGESVPQLEGKPTLDAENAPVWRAWCHLTASRRAGFGGALPIPVSEVQAYLALAHPGLDLDDRVDFLELVSGMDAHWFEVSAELKPKEKGTAKGEGS